MSQFEKEDLELALGAASIGIFKWEVATDRATWCSTVSELFGMGSESYEGSFDLFRSHVHPDDLDELMGIVRATYAAGEEHLRLEHRIRRDDGAIAWAAGRAHVTYGDDGKPATITGAIKDVTDRHVTLEKLAKQNDEYQLYSELATDYIYVVDPRKPTLTPAIIAGSFERVTGYTPSEIGELGGWLEVMHPEDRSSTQPLLDAIQAGKSFVNEYRIIAKDGSVRWLRDKVRPTMSEMGELVSLTGGVQDITARKLLEEQLSHAQKMEAVARLASGVAHDLNNLLTVIYAAVGLLEDDITNDSGRQTLGDLERATERAAELTGALLAVGRKQVAQPKVMLLSDLVERVTPILRRAIGERIELVLEDHSDGARVAVDPAQIDLALLNLAVNARDAMPKGGTLTVQTSVQSLSAESSGRPAELAAGDYASLRMTDTGTGIDRDVLPRVFEPFFTTKGTGKGTGLGLSTVHGMVRQHEGAMKVDSEIGAGTTFTIYLPLSTEALHQPVVRESKRAIGGSERVLMVEDDPLVRETTLRSLTELGYDVTAVETAEEAFPIAAGFDLLVSDVRLPGMAGTDLATQISQNYPTVRILLMSGLVEDPSHKAILEEGRYAFLPKPFTTAGLARRVREVLES